MIKYCPGRMDAWDGTYLRVCTRVRQGVGRMFDLYPNEISLNVNCRFYKHL